MKLPVMLLVCMLLTATSALAIEGGADQKLSVWAKFISFFEATDGKALLADEGNIRVADEGNAVRNIQDADLTRSGAVMDEKLKDIIKVVEPDTDKGACLDLSTELSRVREELEATQLSVEDRIEEARSELESLRGDIESEKARMLNACSFADKMAGTGETCKAVCERSQSTCLFGLMYNGGRLGGFFDSSTPTTKEITGCHVPLTASNSAEGYMPDAMECYCC